MKSHRLFADHDGRKSYASVERAVAEAEKVLAEINEEGDFWYVISAGVIKGAVRYFPVFLPSEDQVQLGIHLAHRGYPFARR